MLQRFLSLTKDYIFFSLYSIEFFRHQENNDLTIEFFVVGICSMSISDLFDRLNQIILNLFTNDRILFVQRMINNELPYPHCIGQDFTWKERPRSFPRERESDKRPSSTLRDKLKRTIESLSCFERNVFETIQVDFNETN